MSAPPIIETVRLTGPRELIEALRPTDARWQNPRSWIFRGQPDAQLQLVPSAFRKEAWVQFRPPGLPPHDPSFSYEQDFCQEIEESALLARYLNTCDRAGLAVAEHAFLRRALGNTGNTTLFENDAVQVFMALAQHYGVPTRLLDWTRVSLNAAYFAAEAALRHNAEHFAVWALSLNIMQKLGTVRAHKPINLELSLAPRAANPNLGAQDGLFTLWWRSNPKVSLPFALDQLLLDTLTPLRASDAMFFGRETALIKFQVPTSAAPALLRMLGDERVDGSRMFPGYAGAAKSLAEESRWDEPLGVGRSMRHGILP